MKSSTCRSEHLRKDPYSGSNLVTEQLSLIQNYKEMRRNSSLALHSRSRPFTRKSHSQVKEMLRLPQDLSSDGQSEGNCQLDSFIKGLSEETMWKCLKVAPHIPCPNASAIEVLVKDLDKHRSEFSGVEIPHIFHQSGTSHGLSQKQLESKNSFLKKHPGWTYRLWNNTENLDLIKKETPWLLSLYQSYPEEIFRADLARLVYMYVYGGVYADLDYFFDQNVEMLSREPGVVLGQMQVDFENETQHWTWPHMVPNALLIGKPRHPFWRLALEMAASSSLASLFKPSSVQGAKYEEMSPEYFTGPVLLLRALKCYSKLPAILTNNTTVQLEPPITFFPKSWAMNTTANQEHCMRSRAPMMYGKTSWDHSWGKQTEAFEAVMKTNKTMNRSQKNVKLESLYNDLDLKDNDRSATTFGSTGSIGLNRSSNAPAKQNAVVFDKQSSLDLEIWTPQHVAFLDQHIRRDARACFPHT